MKFLELLLCLLVFWSVNIRQKLVSADQDEEDYYWKVYTGEIPDDALPGGEDNEGRATYIGQTFDSSDNLIPGEINATSKTFYYAMNRRENSATENLKILCARTPDRYIWIPTNVTGLRFLTHKHLILGGYWGEHPYLIGRIELSERKVVGKIFTMQTDECFGYVVNGRADYITSNFQVLSYNPNKSPIQASSKLAKACDNTFYNTFHNTTVFINSNDL